mgnify:FL=1
MTDSWSGFADLLANLIEKYAAVLDMDHLPDPPDYLEEKFNSIELIDTIEKVKNE